MSATAIAYLQGALHAATAALIVLAIVLALRWLRQAQSSGATSPAASPHQQPLLPGKSADWHAVPGNRLELDSTGFAIAMNTDAHRAWYTLYSPEGLRMAELNDLATLKQCGERFAADRNEFAYRGLPPQTARA